MDPLAYLGRTLKVPWQQGLSGSVQETSLPRLFAFVSHTASSGRLTVSQGRWHAEVDFDRGHAVAASFGDARGLPALEALVLALPTGRFHFYETAIAPEMRNIAATPETTHAFLERLLGLHRSLGMPECLLEAIPQITESASASHANGHLVLDRQLFRTLVVIDGKRTVEEIVNVRQTAEAIVEIAALREQGLVQFRLAEQHVMRSVRSEARYWLRTASLAALASLLVAATYWQEVRIPETPVPGIAVSASAGDSTAPGTPQRR
jgi:hypothetical protein